MTAIDWQAVNSKLPSDVGQEGRQERQVRIVSDNIPGGQKNFRQGH
jgi:hypothetical protein